MQRNYDRFSKKICLITGAGSGIGRSTSIQLGKEGGIVIVVDNNEETGEETAKIITASGGQAIFIKADVSLSSEVQTVINFAINNWKKIDVVVNCAGVMIFKSVIEHSEEEWERVINVNLRSVFLFCKYTLPYINGGAIVNVASVHAHQTHANVSSYAASKGGIEAFTRALSCEFDPSKVRVNCIAPGGVDTPLFWSNPLIKSMNPEDVQCVQPDDIANIICFLASDEAASIHGTTLFADKGLLAAL